MDPVTNQKRYQPSSSSSSSKAAMENNNGNEIQEANITLLPEGCIANVVSFTTPRDACSLSLVSSLFKNASLSDTVWDSFLPPDYHAIISQSSDPSLLSSSSSKKHLFGSLCQKPILIDHGKKSFALDKWSGKKCYMLSARDLNITWGSTPTYWKWNSDPHSRFGEVAELLNVCWLEITGKISTNLLSPSTLYSAYLVFKLKERAHGLLDPPAEAIVGVGAETERNRRTVYLDTDADSSYRMSLRRQGPVMLRTRGGLARRIAEAEPPVAAGPSGESENGPKKRGDGWVEVELGEFFNENVNDEELVVSVLEVKQGNWKSGLVVEGIEIRPKHKI
ncbi:F-box protein At2g02240-like [Mercurialis annua]|uniref:F-box protein At2g02240-like n=1 Tax=Mercurialis annua TaxID=3986 RepID=UPI002160CAA0|nr:F-box protein At2g02240-like [Mercurialis annua]